MWNGMRVIDADAHMHEPQYLWERYVEPKFRERVPKVAFMDGVFMVYEPDGKIIPKGDLQLRPPPSAWAVLEEKYGDAYRQPRRKFCGKWKSKITTVREQFILSQIVS